VAHAPKRAAIPVDHVAHQGISEDVPEAQQHEQEAGQLKAKTNLIGVERGEIHTERQAHARDRDAERGKRQHSRKRQTLGLGLGHGAYTALSEGDGQVIF
jgi:hypothetical protein